MEVFLNIIIFLVLAMLLARLLFRYLAPWLLRRFVERRMKKFGDGYQNFSDAGQEQQGKTYGDIRVDHIPRKEDRKNDCADEEYVDFEELDENEQK